ncbi:MAG: FHA domain-containing protein [Verrucomicrobiales bacterium]
MAKITFTFLDGSDTRVVLEADVLTIGRDDDNQIVLPDQRVSSHHAVLKRTGGGQFILNDLGATNPTRVNGKPTQVHQLRHGDTLLFGDVYAVYESDKLPAADPRNLRRPAPLTPVETTGSGCFALVGWIFMIALAGSALASVLQ